MRRWLTILLLVLLPLQFAWASAASYCAHEKNPKATHVGHHAHEHGGASASPEPTPGDDASNASAGMDHADCSYCHLSCAKSFAVARPDHDSRMREAFALRSAPEHSSLSHQRIERPKWQRAV